MKSCEWCGRENQDDATVCSGCGTSEFEEKISSVAAGDADTAADAPIELERCGDPASLKQLTRLLDAEGIAYKSSTLPTMFDVGSMRASGGGEVIVTVPRHLYPAARSAMEKESLKVALPDGHHLLSSTDEELAEIVGQASEWSAFDVAHARRLIAERGIDLKKIEDKNAEHILKLRQGKPASKKLVFFGWVFSLLGGVIGLGIAFSLCYLKEKTPQGEFFTYDEPSRAMGKKMLKVAVPVITLSLILRLFWALFH